MVDAVTQRAVIFDMDGVLTDSEPLINQAAVAMFRELGLNVAPEDFLPFVGTGEDRYIGGVARKHGFTIHLPSAKKRTYELYLELLPNHLRAFPGAARLVQECRAAGLKTAVASSADRIKIEANLRQIGLPPESWDAIVSGEDVQDKKPAPDIFLAASRKLEVNPADCVVIEDAPNGIHAAKAAGMPCVAVAHTFPVDQLAAADRIRSSIDVLTPGNLLDEPTAPSPHAVADPTSSPMAWTPPSRTLAQPYGFWATLGLALLIAGGILLTELAVVVVLELTMAATSYSDGLEAVPWAANGFLWAFATLITTPVAVGLVVMIAWLKRGFSVRDYLALRPVSSRRLFRWCIALLGFAIAADLTSYALQRPIVPEVMLEAYRTAGWAPLFWIAVVVCAPIGEELFFRGFLFKGWVHSPLGGWGTVIITSFVWALVHQQYDVYGITVVFAAGLLLGYSRLRSGSLYPAIAMHALMNVLAMSQTAAFVHFDFTAPVSLALPFLTPSLP
jgi:beta-phosphoglucomutase